MLISGLGGYGLLSVRVGPTGEATFDVRARGGRDVAEITIREESARKLAYALLRRSADDADPEPRCEA